MLLFTTSLFTLLAQTNSRVVETLYYNRGAYITSDAERAKLNNLVEQMKSDSTLKIHIIGYGDKWGGKEVNDRFSHTRAMYIADWMRSCRVPSDQITFAGEGIDTLASSDAKARRVEVTQIVETIATPQPQPKTEEIKEEQPQERLITSQTKDATTAKPTEEANTAMQVEPKTKPEGESQVATISEQEAKRSCFSLRTNLLYWLCGMMNIGAEYKLPDSNFGVVLNGGYSPFGNSNWNHSLGGWFVAPEVRYYLPVNEQWFVGAQFLASGYNVKLSDTGYQGTVIGGGVMGGYNVKSLTDHTYFGMQRVIITADEVVTSNISIEQISRDINFNIEIVEGDTNRISSISSSLSGIANQWGRKDPLISTPTSMAASATRTISDVVKAPTYFYCGNATTTDSDWCGGSTDWDQDRDHHWRDPKLPSNQATSGDKYGTTKSIYDPSPLGFMVPCSSSTSSHISVYSFMATTTSSYADYVRTYTSDDSPIVFPYAGYLAFGSGSLSSYNSRGSYNCAPPLNATTSYYFVFNASAAISTSGYARSYGQSVRSIQE